MRRTQIALLFAAALTTTSAFAAATSGLGIKILVNGTERPEYSGRGNLYVEAIRGSDYAIRLTNTNPYRIAVALSVDGLNSIDARHTAAWDAAKWVLEPYESTVISGWQVSQRTARRFYFTGERDSYGAAIGRTENLGVIEAVAYRENVVVDTYAPPLEQEKSAAGGTRNQAAPAPSSAKAQAGLSDDYAGTGIGSRTRHSVRTVDIELNPNPIGSIRIRYEFHPQLVKLGILPRTEFPLERREHARGFESYCPQP